MEAIPLVRARYAAAFAATLDHLGAKAGSFLERARLPASLLEHPDGLIGAHNLWSFAGDAARRTGIRDLGLRAGSMPVEAHGDFGTRVVYAPTLHRAICTFCAEALAEYSGADFYLMREDETAWFCRGPIVGTADQIQQVELYVMALMVQTIRMATGPRWQPARVQLQNNDARGLAHVTLIRRADVDFGAPETRIALPVSALHLPLEYAPGKRIPDESNMASDHEATAPAEDFIASLNALIASHIRRGPLPVHVVAEIAGVSVRTLQRRLGQRGSNYSQLVEQARYRAATKLLRRPEARVTETAFELGYSDVAHFTRAFKRMAGVSPGEYRRGRTG